MSLGIQIDVRSDTLAAGMTKLRTALTPARLNPVIGVAARNVVRAHLREKDASSPNRLGGARTHFYLGAAEGTSWSAVADGVVVSIASVGIRQRYYGGTIRPRTKKFLTIPAISEAYGKRASEFQGLRFAFVLDPKYNAIRPALVQGAHSLLKRRKVKGEVRAYKGGTVTERVVFWLTREVTQQADPTVLPTTFDLYAGIRSNLNAYIDRLFARADGAPSN